MMQIREWLYSDAFRLLGWALLALMSTRYCAKNVNVSRCKPKFTSKQLHPPPRLEMFSLLSVCVCRAWG